MIKGILHTIRVQDKLKNILIFLPIFFDSEINITKVIDLTFGFILFFFLTNIVYIINDFSDVKKDKINKLKKYKINKNLSYLILIISILSILLIYFYKIEIFNNYFYLYILVFLSYNFFLKNFKYLDVIILGFFYLIRIYYGFEVYEKLEISIGFSVFFLILFIYLAFTKKYIQICVNNFDISKKIIPYNYKDIPKIKKINFFLCVINFILIFLFFIHSYFIKVNFLFIYESKNSFLEVFSFFIFFIIFIIKSNQILNTVPKKDIISLYLYDFKFLLSFILMILFFLFI
jgi:4-hydroxybenzoate polyprenyltransferase